MMAFYGAARGGDVRIVGAHVSGSTACINEQRAELQTITLIRRSKKEREKEARWLIDVFIPVSYPPQELSSALNALQLIGNGIFFTRLPLEGE